MTSLMDKFDSYLSGGDPVFKNRYLLKTIHPILCIVISYILFVKLIGPYLMKNRKPIQMRPLIVLYNFSLVAFYIWFLYGGVIYLYNLGFSLFCGPLNRTKSPLVLDIYAHAYAFYCIRLVELLDTIFLVFSKKFNMITSLHVFHHSVVPIFGWFAFRSETCGYLALYMGLNGFVHVIMYSYYAIAALGPKYQKYIWWKRYLTTLQIAQFMFITIYLNVMYAIGCMQSQLVFVFSTLLTMVFFFWFMKYFQSAYTTTQTVEEKMNVVTKPKEKLKGIGVHKNGGLPVKNWNSMTKKE